MSGRLVIAFSAEQKAENAGRKLLSMQKQGQIDIEDAVAALKRANGALKLKQCQMRAPSGRSEPRRAVTLLHRSGAL